VDVTKPCFFSFFVKKSHYLCFKVLVNLLGVSFFKDAPFFLLNPRRVSFISEFGELPGYWRRQRNADVPIPSYTRHITGPHHRQYLLAFAPKEVTQQSAVVYLHGGGWQFGRPEYFGLQAGAFSEWGFPSFFISHRKLPWFDWQDMLEDLSRGLELVERLVERDFPEVDTLILGGMSSGGHLATLYLLNQAKKAKSNGGITIRGVFGLGAPLDLTTLGKIPTVHFLTRKTGLEVANPCHYFLPPDFPDMLILHGKKDGMVPFIGTSNFAARFDSSPARLSMPPLPDDTHLSVASWSQPDSPLRNLVRDWLTGLSC
jgi:acetyl esterase/lipase